MILLTLLLSTSMRILCAMVILVLTIRVQINLKPYKEEENNKIDILAISAGIITLSSGLIYSQEDSVNGLNLMFLILAFIFNIFVILEWTYLLAK